jgi:hypothetical protein
MRFILGQWQRKNPAGNKGFDMDFVEIVAPRANGEAVFWAFLSKMAFGL